MQMRIHYFNLDSIFPFYKNQWILPDNEAGFQLEKYFKMGIWEAASLAPCSDPYLILLGSVSSTIVARKLLEVSSLVAFVVAVHGPHYTRPRLGEHLQHTSDVFNLFLHMSNQVREGGLTAPYQVSFLIRTHRLAVLVHDMWLNAEERIRRWAWLHRSAARQRGDRVTTCLRLPKCVHDGAPAVTYHFVIPDPSLGVDWLTDCTEHLERTSVIPVMVEITCIRSCSRKEGVWKLE